MSIKFKLLAAGSVMLSVMIATTSVSAAVIIKAFSGGPLSVANPLGTLPAIKLSKKNTYDFTFSMTADPGSFASVQLLAQLLTKGTSIPEQIQYSLFKTVLLKGMPSIGTFVAQSSLDYSPTIAFKPEVGSYYVRVDNIAANNEVVGGTVTTAVPEPASWAMMLVGFGALGSVLRRRGAKTSLNAA